MEYEDLSPLDRDIFDILYWSPKPLHEDAILACLNAKKWATELKIVKNNEEGDNNIRFIFELFFRHLLNAAEYLVPLKIVPYYASKIVACELGHAWWAMHYIRRKKDTSDIFGSWSVNENDELVRNPEKPQSRTRSQPWP